ncbi:ACT domain-containing protein [Kribbella flavida]|uniref:ACT domain-containing protein n=1 Tax=Kribbella flavida TaxID=182640 RepID=UPI00059CB043|nr:ACT domain-containing protein [Kribbella flavida]
MTDAQQRLRILPEPYQIEHHPAGDEVPAGVDWLALVRSPDGLTVVRPGSGWIAFYSGDTAHELDVPGMLSALLVPLKEAGISVFVASTYAADLVLVPADRRDEAVAALRKAGHHVAD